VDAAQDGIGPRRSPRFATFVAQALEDFLAVEQENLDAIREGLDDLTAGRVTPHEEVRPRIEAMRNPAALHNPAAVSFTM
jgi:predicted transcriptional regulator